MLILDKSTTIKVQQYGKDVVGEVKGGKINRLYSEKDG